MTSIARSVLVASCLILSSLPSLCQEEPVVLTATGYGQSIDEAITSSVRSALEQTFGVFLSSDTRTNISEDATSQTMEVIDEIATLSKGNIVEYEVISSSLLESGEAVATTRCTIALEPMKSFVNAKGHHAEFSQDFAVQQASLSCCMLCPQQAGVYVPRSAKAAAMDNAKCCGCVSQQVPLHFAMEVFEKGHHPQPFC